MDFDLDRWTREHVILQEGAVATASGAVLREEGVGGLRESDSDPARVLIDMITPGWGSSGFYSQDVLERDGPRIYPAGTHMYIDHPTISDEHERPERSVKDLAAVTEADARWDATRGALCAPARLFPDHREDIRAKAPHIGVSIRAAGDIEEGEAEGRNGNIITGLHEGLSVDFVTKAGRGGKIGELLESAREERRQQEREDEGEVEETEDPRVTRLLQETRVLLGEPYGIRMAGGEHCVYNTDTGANVPGGCHPTHADALRHQRALMVNVPDATEGRTSGKRGKESRMGDDQRMSELEESVRHLRERDEARERELQEERTKRERAEDALLENSARQVVSEFIAENQEGDDPLPELPDRAWKRVREAATAGKLPLDSEGKLIPSELERKVREAAKDEAEYLGIKADEGGRGRVRGMGGSETRESGDRNDDENNNDQPLSEADEKRLQESMQRLGSTEKAAQVAVKGR